MNTNLVNYRVGRKVLVTRNDWLGDDRLIEVEILQKAAEGVKVEVLSEGWWKVGTVTWLSTNDSSKEYWFAMASTGWSKYQDE